MKWRLFIAIIILSIVTTPSLFADKETTNKTVSLTKDQSTMKIIERNRLQNEGWRLAKKGEYNAALIKYHAAMNPSLLNYDYEKGLAEAAIVDIYKRQGRFEEALKIVDCQLGVLKNEKYPINGITGYERAYNKRIELLALIKARDTNNAQPIYDYIGYIKFRYSKLLPPNGYATGFTSSRIDDLIHLYDYLHDYDAGIAFMDEIIKYHSQHKNKDHRSAHEKDVKEYTRVKQAWELDKKTGQHGHLKEVIRTSDVISW